MESKPLRNDDQRQTFSTTAWSSMSTPCSLTYEIVAKPCMLPHALECIEKHGECAQLSDSNGDIPLHWCTSMNCSAKIVEALLRSYPEGVHERNKAGRTPVDDFFGVDKFQDHGHHSEHSQHEISFRYRGIVLPNESLYVSETDESDLLNNAFMILYVLENGRLAQGVSSSVMHNQEKPLMTRVFFPSPENHTKENNQFLVLHASLAERRCPILFSHLFLKNHPYQAWARDKNGKLPLELALSYKNYCWDEFASFIQALLQLYPDGGSLPDLAHDRLPLTKCAMLGMDVGIGKDDQTISSAQLILKSAPLALTTSDSKTHMLPFMIVAARSYHSGRKCTNNRSLDDERQQKVEKKLGLKDHMTGKRQRLSNLSTLYSWIMLDPNILVSGRNNIMKRT